MATQFFTAFYTAPRLVNEDLVHTSFSFDSLAYSVRMFLRRAVSYSLASVVGVLLVAACHVRPVNGDVASVDDDRTRLSESLRAPVSA